MAAPRDMRPLYRFGSDSTTNEFTCNYAMSRFDTFSRCDQRFYTRYAQGGIQNNKVYYDKLISGSQFTKELFTSMQTLIDVEDSGAGSGKVDKNKNRTLSYEQYSNCTRDTDTTADKPPAVVALKYPKARSDRCMSAYNQITKELVVQFMPILEDRFSFKNFFGLTSNVPTDAMAMQSGQRYQQWFFDKLLELNTFLAHSANPLPGCKRHIFSVFIENDELKNENSDILNWTTENAPLFYLHVKYSGSLNKSATLTGIEVRLHNNCEILGFNLYGNVEVLYGLERFYTEYLTFFDELRYDKVTNAESQFCPLVHGSFAQVAFNGQWFKSKNKSTGNDAKFGAGWTEFMYRTVDLYDKKDLYAKVRTKYYRDTLKSEALGQLARVIAWNQTNKHAAGLKFDATSHRGQLVFRPISRANMLDTNDWSERATDFGLDKLTNLQSFALLTYTSMLTRLHAASTFVQRATSYFGVTISNTNVGPKSLGGAAVANASYMMSIMGGWEYDLQRYSNFVVEPCTQMKTLMGLSFTPKMTPDRYVRLEQTGNDVVALAKGGEQLKKHPLYDGDNGVHVASASKGSFWRFPVKLSADTRSFDCTKLTTVATSDLMSYPARNNEISRIAVDFVTNSQFYNVAQLTNLKAKKWARGGVVKNSSIRVELPTFLKESYDFRGQKFQEHTTFTVDVDLFKDLTKAEKRLERKRLGYFDVSKRSIPQPIKKKRSTDIRIQFFLANGSRPHQDNKGTLTDAKTANTIYAPFRNVKVSIYTPKLANHWFNSINRVDFIANEVKKQIKTAAVAAGKAVVKKFDTKTIDVMLTLYNTYNRMRRLSSSVGGASDTSLSGIISESIDTNGSFYGRLSAAWQSVQNGNRAFRDHFFPLTTASKRVVLPRVLMDYFVPSTGSIRDAFEFMFELQSVTIPLNVVGLENDETLYILTDYDMKPSQETNINGAYDKKIVGKIELKAVQSLEAKRKKYSSLTFSTDEGSTHDGYLQSTPISIRSLHDVRNYKFFFVNSALKPVTFTQKFDWNTNKIKVESVDLMGNYFVCNNLQISH